MRNHVRLGRCRGQWYGGMKAPGRAMVMGHGCGMRWEPSLVPSAKVCMFKAVAMRDGTSLIQIFRVNTSLSPTFVCGQRKSISICHAPMKRAWSMLVRRPPRSVNGGCLQNQKECVDISSAKVVWACNWDELED